MNKSKAVEEYLKKNGSITSWDAIQMFRATRLSAIIFNLRQRYQIDTIMEDGTDSRYARYYFRGELDNE